MLVSTASPARYLISVTIGDICQSFAVQKGITVAAEIVLTLMFAVLVNVVTCFSTFAADRFDKATTSLKVMGDAQRFSYANITSGATLWRTIRFLPIMIVLIGHTFGITTIIAGLSVCTGCSFISVLTVWLAIRFVANSTDFGLAASRIYPFVLAYRLTLCLTTACASFGISAIRFDPYMIKNRLALGYHTLNTPLRRSA